MTLIPWVKNKTVVTEDHLFNPNGSAVLISPFDETQFTNGSTNASYDLRVGPAFRIFGDASRSLGERETFRLPPGKAALIETEERVHFPNSVFGIIVPRESKIRDDGISNTPTKVDPGYPGKGVSARLHVAVFNHGTKPARLKHGDRFCALCLFQVLEESVVPYDKGPKDDLDVKSRGPSSWAKIGKWVGAHWWPIVATVLGIVNIWLYITHH